MKEQYREILPKVVQRRTPTRHKKSAAKHDGFGVIKVVWGKKIWGHYAKENKNDHK
jgi:hypothetical protein